MLKLAFSSITDEGVNDAIFLEKQILDVYSLKNFIQTLMLYLTSETLKNFFSIILVIAP